METERYPLSVSLTGVLHKENNKMYILSVLWSDENEIVIYRSFLDFKNMHKQLKKKFPSASKMNKSDRILPKFKGIKMKKKGQTKGPEKSLVQIKYLQKYCNELLSCDPKVSQSADLIRFFQAKEQELQPDFTKNCIIIMHSEDEIRSNGGHSNSGSVTQPFVTETYQCVSQYETKDIKNKPLKVAAGEKLDVLIKDEKGWWLVETEGKQMAWFPAPYLEKLEDEEEDEDEMGGFLERGIQYTVVKSYKTNKVDEISVNIGSVVEVLQKSENGWWLIRYNGKIGYIPTIHLQPYGSPLLRKPQHQGPFSLSSLLTPTSTLQHSRSRGNLQQLPPVLSLSPNPTQENSIQRSRSLNQLSEQPAAQPAGHQTASRPSLPAKPAPHAVQVFPPAITVQMDDEEQQGGRMLTAHSDDSFESDSFSDDAGSTSGGSSFNLSYSYNDDRLKLSHTPPPMTNNQLSPTSHPEVKLLPSVSDPNLYKGPTSPKVPPRPRTQEILTRCSTLTRKNVAKNNLPSTQLEVA